MRRKKKYFAVAVTMLASASFLAACSNSSTSSKNQVLHWSVSSELETMDPALSVDSTSGVMLRNAYEGLYEYNSKGKVNPVLAQKTTVSKDGLTYTFKLRKDARWSNGDKVTAKDFVYAWKRAADPKTGSSNATYLASLKNGADVVAGKKDSSTLGVEAKDNYTLVAHLDHKVPYFKQLLCTYVYLPLNQKAVEKYGKKYGTAAKYTVSNGAFKMTEWTGSSSKWTFVKNKYYWGKKDVNLDKVTVLVTKSPSTAYNLYQTNKLDMVTLSSEQARSLKSNSDYVVREQARMDYLDLNKSNELLANKNVRLALGYALNRKQMVNKVLGNGSKTPYAAAPIDFSSYNGKEFAKDSFTGKSTTYNKKLAQKYWKKGLEELGKSGQNVSLALLGDDDDTTKALTEYIQSALQSTLPNLKVNVTNMPKTQRIARMKSGNFDVVYTSWGAAYADPNTYLSLFTSSSAYNFGKWDNSEYDALVNKANTTDASNPSKRWNDMVKAEKLLLDDGAVLPTLQPANATMLKSKVKGLEYTPVVGYNWKHASIK